MVQKNFIVSKPVLIISGATSSGKSSFAIKCAKMFGGEIISADSMQIYRGMDIGTAKVSAHEQNEVKHHLIDIREVGEGYSVAQFKEDCEKIINDCHSRKVLPIICGGTGLYINSVLFNYQFGGEGKYEKGQPKYKFCTIVLELAREWLYERINARVEDMISSGLEQEVKRLFTSDNEEFLNRTIGYKEFVSYFKGELPKEEAVDLIKQHTRNYAKRQITWFKQWDEFAHRVNAFNPDECLEIIRRELCLN